MRAPAVGPYYLSMCYYISMGYRLLLRPQAFIFIFCYCVRVFAFVRLWDCGVVNLWVLGGGGLGGCVCVCACVCVCVFCPKIISSHIQKTTPNPINTLEISIYNTNTPKIQKCIFKNSKINGKYYYIFNIFENSKSSIFYFMIYQITIMYLLYILYI